MIKKQEGYTRERMLTGQHAAGGAECGTRASSLSACSTPTVVHAHSGASPKRSRSPSALRSPLSLNNSSAGADRGGTPSPSARSTASFFGSGEPLRAARLQCSPEGGAGGIFGGVSAASFSPHHHQHHPLAVHHHHPLAQSHFLAPPLQHYLMMSSAAAAAAAAANCQQQQIAPPATTINASRVASLEVPYINNHTHSHAASVSGAQNVQQPRAAKRHLVQSAGEGGGKSGGAGSGGGGTGANLM